MMSSASSSYTESVVLMLQRLAGEPSILTLFSVMVVFLFSVLVVLRVLLRLNMLFLVVVVFCVLLRDMVLLMLNQRRGMVGVGGGLSVRYPVSLLGDCCSK